MLCQKVSVVCMLTRHCRPAGLFSDTACFPITLYDGERDIQKILHICNMKGKCLQTIALFFFFLKQFTLDRGNYKS